MSGRDPYGDSGAGDAGDAGAWHEPEHLRRGLPPSGDDGASWREPADPPAEQSAQQPARQPDEPPGEARPDEAPRHPAGGLPGELDRVFGYQGDRVGAEGWALQHGWTLSDGTGPADAPLAELIASAPAPRISRDHRPATVLRGRFGNLELVAFDVVYTSGRMVVPQYAITAAPLLAPVPSFRLSPTRFWKRRTGGLMVLPSGDAEFDARWVLLTAEDAPAVRSLAGDAKVRDLLLASDDGDEFWSAAGARGGGAGNFVAAIRPDGHRPELIEHHGRLLTAVVTALMSAV